MESCFVNNECFFVCRSENHMSVLYKFETFEFTLEVYFPLFKYRSAYSCILLDSCIKLLKI